MSHQRALKKDLFLGVAFMGKTSVRRVAKQGGQVEIRGKRIVSAITPQKKGGV